MTRHNFAAGFVLLIICVVECLGASGPVFYRDVLPLLQEKCMECHRAGGAAKPVFGAYRGTRPWAKAIRASVVTGRMPPWFADPCCGKFSNDRSLSTQQKKTLVDWVDSGASAGDTSDAPAAREWPTGWSIGTPDRVLTLPQSFRVPARGELEYQYFVLPTGFTEDKWVQASEVLPGAAGVIHHAVVYVRERGDRSFPNPQHSPTRADILNVYAPGAVADVSPQGMGKLVKAGSDLVLEIHYTPNGRAVLDQTRVGLRFAAERPAKRVLTLQMTNDRFLIPAGMPDFRLTVSGTLPHDGLLLGFFPHLHLRGKAFEYTIVKPGGQVETLLKVNPYDFFWQLYYRLAIPLALKAGTRLQWIANYDNSSGNPRNPDATVDVGYGPQSRDEMMVGFFDVAVDAGVDKNAYFVR